MTFKPIGALLGVGLIAVLILIAQSTRDEVVHLVSHDVPIEAPKSERVNSSSSAERVAAAEAVPTSPSSLDTKVSVRTVLAEYWGGDWPDMQARLLAAGVQLDGSYEGGTWDEAAAVIGERIPLGEAKRAAHVRDTVQWAESMTTSWVKEEFGVALVTEEDLVAVEEIARPFNEELSLVGDQLATQIDFLVRLKWQNGDYVKAPFTTVGIPIEMGFHSSAFAGAGWAVTITLTETDHPEITEIFRRGTQLRSSREEKIRRYFSGDGR